MVQINGAVVVIVNARLVSQLNVPRNLETINE